MSILSLEFEVIRKYTQGAEKIIAAFSEKNDAVEYMEKKAVWDNQTKIDTVYFLKSHDEELAKLISSQTDKTSAAGSGASSSDPGSKFNPNPFSTTARPAGMQSSFTNPQKDSIDDEDI